MPTLDHIGIFVAAASFFGFLYELRLKDRTIERWHRNFVRKLGRARKYDVSSIFYRSLKVSGRILTAIYGTRRSDTYIFGYVSSRSWKASCTISVVYCIIIPLSGIGILGIILSTDKIAPLIYLAYTILSVIFIKVFSEFLIKKGLPLHRESRFAVVCLSFAPVTVYALFLTAFFTIRLIWFDLTSDHYTLYILLPSLFPLYLISILTSLIVSFWLTPWAVLVSPALAHTAPTLLVFLVFIIFGIFAGNGELTIYLMVVLEVIVILATASMISIVAVPFFPAFLLKYKIYNISLISLFLAQIFLLDFILTDYWVYFAIGMAIWGIFFAFIIINGLADTLSVAITRQIIDSILKKMRWYRLLYFLFVDIAGAILCTTIVFMVIIAWINIVYILFLSQEVKEVLISIGSFGDYVIVVHEVINSAVKAIIFLDFLSLYNIFTEGVGIKIGDLDPHTAMAVAITTLFSTVAIFASTTYIPTIINIFFLIFYPIWDIIHHISRISIVNLQIILTSGKKIFGLRVSSFYVGCVIAALALALRAAILNLIC